MKNFLFVASLIALIITAGCVNQNNNPPVPATPQVVYVTVLVTPTQTQQVGNVTVPVDPNPKNRVVAATAQQTDATHMIVTYQGGQDSPTCIGFLWRVSDPTGTVIDSNIMGVNTNFASATVLTPGERLTLSATPGKDHVVGTAYFRDGSSQVIFDAYI